MKWRLKEGNGEAIYEIGVEDNGLMTGLLKEDLDASMKTLSEMANRFILTDTKIKHKPLNFFYKFL